MNHPARIGYVIGEFPSISETFIYTELHELERRGVEPVIFALTNTRAGLCQPSVRQFVKRVHFAPNTIFLHREGWRGLLHPQAINQFLFLAPLSNIALLWKAKKIFPNHFFLSHWLAQEIKRLGITRLHAHFPEPSLVALLASLRTGIPFSFTVHSHLESESHFWISERVKHAVRTIAISEHTKQLLLLQTGQRYQSKMSVIPCNINISLHHKLMIEVGNIKKISGFPIIAVGRLVEQKGFVYLLRAVASLRKTHPDIRLTIIGDGPLKKSLRREATRLKIERLVRFLGPMVHDVRFAREILSHCVFVLPCVTLSNHDQDGLPVAILEAMYYGLPIISTTVGSIPDVVTKEFGILVPEKNVSSLARSIIAFSAMPREQLGAMGRIAMKRVARNETSTHGSVQLAHILTNNT